MQKSRQKSDGTDRLFQKCVCVGGRGGGWWVAPCPYPAFPFRHFTTKITSNQSRISNSWLKSGFMLPVFINSFHFRISQSWWSILAPGSTWRARFSSRLDPAQMKQWHRFFGVGPNKEFVCLGFSDREWAFTFASPDVFIPNSFEKHFLVRSSSNMEKIFNKLL